MGSSTLADRIANGLADLVQALGNAPCLPGRQRHQHLRSRYSSLTRAISAVIHGWRRQSHSGLPAMTSSLMAWIAPIC